MKHVSLAVAFVVSGCLALGGCKKKDQPGVTEQAAQAGGEAKVLELCKKKGDMHEGFVKILEDNTKTPQDGFKKAKEYVDKTGPEMAKVGEEIFNVIAANKPASAAWFSKCSQEMNAKNATLAQRVRPASRSYPPDVGDLRQLSQSLLQPFMTNLGKVKSL